MSIINISEAKMRLAQLIKRVWVGDNIDTSLRVGGQWAGQVKFIGSWEEGDCEIEKMFEESEIFSEGDG